MNGAWLVMTVYVSAVALIETAVWWDKIGKLLEGIKTGIMNTFKWVCWFLATGVLGHVGRLLWDMRKDFQFQFRNWLARPERPARAERRAIDLKREIEWLEHISDQWNELRMMGRTPLWTDVFGWIEDATVCPCGYVRECAIWCGDGSCHGMTDDNMRAGCAGVVGKPANVIVGPREYLINPASFYGITAAEFTEAFHALGRVIGPTPPEGN